jgi:hypothetical protein
MSKAIDANFFPQPDRSSRERPSIARSANGIIIGSRPEGPRWTATGKIFDGIGPGIAEAIRILEKKPFPKEISKTLSRNGRRGRI